MYVRRTLYVRNLFIKLKGRDGHFSSLICLLNQDLAAINEMIRSQPARNGVKRKVLLQDDDEVQTVKKAAGEEGEVLVFGGERKDEAGQ